MDWSDERYVRLYTRDTATWKRLKWQGQTVLMHLLRKVDRAGVLETKGESDAAAAIEAVTDLPNEVVEPGLKKLLEQEVVALRGNMLLFPKFIEAQEAHHTDAHRMREYRARRRDRARLGLGPDVTERNDHETPRNAQKKGATKGAKDPIVTPRNEPVDNPHAPVTPGSGSVTPSLAQPSLAVPTRDRSGNRSSKTASSSQAEASPAGAREAPAPAAAPEQGLPARPVRRSALVSKPVDSTEYQPMPEHETYAVAMGLTPDEYRAVLAEMVGKFASRGYAPLERWDTRLAGFVDSAALNKKSRPKARAAPTPQPKIGFGGALSRSFFGSQLDDDDEEVKQA